MPEKLTADVEAWAEAHGTVRSDAIRQLMELARSIPAVEERERRIRRLTEGPPEFSDERIDLPKPKK
jgi:hypothetical protein